MPASAEGFSEAPQDPYGPQAIEVSVHQAKTHLSRLLVRVEAGATVVITRRGKPVAKLVAAETRPRREFGSMIGMFTVDDRFFEPLPEDELRAWEGN